MLDGWRLSDLIADILGRKIMKIWFVLFPSGRTSPSSISRAISRQEEVFAYMDG